MPAAGSRVWALLFDPHPPGREQGLSIPASTCWDKAAQVFSRAPDSSSPDSTSWRFKGCWKLRGWRWLDGEVPLGAGRGVNIFVAVRHPVSTSSRTGCCSGRSASPTSSAWTLTARRIPGEDFCSSLQGARCLHGGGGTGGRIRSSTWRLPGAGRAGCSWSPEGAWTAAAPKWQ